MNSTALVLKVIHGPDLDCVFELPSDRRHLIGRRHGSVPLTDHQTSRSHAEVFCKQGVWHINDLRSTNGTFVNHIRITQPTPLNKGDSFRIGSNTLSVVMERAAIAAGSGEGAIQPQDRKGQRLPAERGSAEQGEVIKGEEVEPSTEALAAALQGPRATAQSARQPREALAADDSEHGELHPIERPSTPSALGQAPVLRGRGTEPVLAPGGAAPPAGHHPLVDLAQPRRQTPFIVWVIVALLVLANSVLIYQLFGPARKQTEQMLEELVAQARQNPEENQKLIEEIGIRIGSNLQKSGQSLLEEMRVTLQTQLPQDTGALLSQILTQVQSQPRLDNDQVAAQVAQAVRQQSTEVKEEIIQEITRTLRSRPAEPTASDQLLQQILTQLRMQSAPAGAATPIGSAPGVSLPAVVDPASSTASAGNPSRPATDFSPFGRIIFLVDASGSLIDTLPRVVAELGASIGQLDEHQFFTVIFFQHNAAIEVPPRGLKAASPKMKEQTIDWIDPDTGHILPSGSSNPVNALKVAMGYAPDLVCIFSDRITGKGPGEIDRDQLLGLLRELNPSRYTIFNTVQFFYPDPQETLKTIALEYGGVYRFVRESQPLPIETPVESSAEPKSSGETGEPAEFSPQNRVTAKELLEDVP
jgi:hypothetical protein